MAARYCLDSSALIDAWRDQYRPASFPTFWQRIDGLIDGGILISPQEVREELKGPPDLVAWDKERDALLCDLDEELQHSVRTVLADLADVMLTRGLRFIGKALKADSFAGALAGAATYVCSDLHSRIPSGCSP